MEFKVEVYTTYYKSENTQIGSHWFMDNTSLSKDEGICG
jgi:hypothetical protein